MAISTNWMNAGATARSGYGMYIANTEHII